MKPTRFPAARTAFAVALALGLAATASAQTRADRAASDQNTRLANDRLDRNLSRVAGLSGPRQTVVLTQRPLRTFRGVAVNAGRYANDDRAIGIVRPIRVRPNVDPRTAYSAYNRFDRSDRWALREVARGRILLDVRPDPYTRVEKSIGVVRPYRTYDPVIRNGPRTLTNPDPLEAPSIAKQYRELTDGQLAVTALAEVRIPAAAAGRPWTLLSEGYYREARQAFADLGDPDDTARTGHALAAALHGDLTGAAELMPDAPRVADEAAFTDTARRRVELLRQYLFEGDESMQAALQTILDQTRPSGESMQ
jgi:hypothetical protein